MRPLQNGRCVGCSAIRSAVECCIGRLVRLDPDAVLNADELRGVSLAFGADEGVAQMIVVATNLRPMTDGADHSRLTHGNIFARHDWPGPCEGHSSPRAHDSTSAATAISETLQAIALADDKRCAGAESTGA